LDVRGGYLTTATTTTAAHGETETDTQCQLTLAVALPAVQLCVDSALLHLALVHGGQYSDKDAAATAAAAAAAPVPGDEYDGNGDGLGHGDGRGYDALSTWCDLGSVDDDGDDAASTTPFTADTAATANTAAVAATAKAAATTSEQRLWQWPQFKSLHIAAVTVDVRQAPTAAGRVFVSPSTVHAVYTRDPLLFFAACPLSTVRATLLRVHLLDVSAAVAPAIITQAWLGDLGSRQLPALLSTLPPLRPLAVATKLVAGLGERIGLRTIRGRLQRATLTARRRWRDPQRSTGTASRGGSTSSSTSSSTSTSTSTSTRNSPEGVWAVLVRLLDRLVCEAVLAGKVIAQKVRPQLQQRQQVHYDPN
jgi:hypothetical protein